MDILLRRAVPSDGAEIAELYLASRADAFPGVRSPHTDDEVRTWVTSVMLHRGHVWVAVDDGVIAGFLALLDDAVDQLYLRPDYVRRGIGSRLLALAKQTSPRHLALYTFQCNARARAFYEAHGFRATRFGDGSKNEEREPDVFYEWHGLG